jgi:alpha-amylase
LADFKPKRLCLCHLEENNPKKVTDNPFTPSPVYNYNISAGKNFDFDKKVNYFENGFNNMINFEFKYDAQKKI